MAVPGVEQAVPDAVPTGAAVPAAVPAPDPRTETARAVGLAAAAMGGNLISVVFTVVFTRLLGADGYGSLAALVNLSIILFVPGSALQAAAAREGALGRLGRGRELAATLDRWTRRLAVTLVAVVAVSVLAREPLAALLDVEQAWAAAAVPLTGMLWLLLSLQRGLLQSTRAYRAVGTSIVLEALGRLLVGVALFGAGLGVSGAYLGTPASLAVAAIVLSLVLRRRLGPPDPATPRHPLRTLARGAAVPVAALTLVAALQNIDVIMAKHALSEDAAGIYAAATVAAKAVVWIAIGVGLYVLPEVTRVAADGGDPRRVLLRALALVGGLAACALAVFAAVPELLLRTAFGADYEPGAAILPVLGAAFALLAAAYLAVQYQLGLHHRRFLVALAAAAAAEPLLLLLGGRTLESFATVVLLVQVATAAGLLAISASRPARGLAPA